LLTPSTLLMLHTLENEALRAVGYWLLLSAAWYGAKFAAKARPVDGSTRLGGMTDTLLGAFLAASRLRPDQQDELGARVSC
jgi:hypothetical protein